jgi:hypothetical protein
MKSDILVVKNTSIKYGGIPMSGHPNGGDTEKITRDCFDSLRVAPAIIWKKRPL